MKNVFVIGSGGREHAIVDAMKRSPQVGRIYCAPGNAGIARQATPVDIHVDDTERLLQFAKEADIDLTVVGPEIPLSEGIVDLFRQNGLRVFGPTKKAAQLETSKAFAKEIMQKYGIPTAESRTFSNYDEALAYIKSGSEKSVIKYDGLAAGKGVVVAMNHAEAEEALSDMLLDKKFGEGRVVVEEFLDGPEFSFFCLVNGDKIWPMDMARDHKRAFDGNCGPNTGGMGAYSPVDFIDDEIRDIALNTIMRPVANAMVKEGIPFTGLLYGGLILNNGVPKVIEFNARFGDPETEVLLPRLDSDFYQVISDATDGNEVEMKWNPEYRVGVVLAADGYPGKYEKGHKLEGIEESEALIYHMGTGVDGNGRLVSTGGRVLMITASGKSLADAANRALEATCNISDQNNGYFYRSDIGLCEQ